MASNAQGRMRRLSTVPIFLLFLALATVFFFGGGRGHSYQIDSANHHDDPTYNHMTVALNLSPEHDFLGFHSLTLDEDGDLTYQPYNRFPVLGHALIKLATLPFADDASMRLAAARILMLAFFVAVATLAYLALCRLTANRWAALAATLLAFSSYYALHYNDMVATLGAIDLFGLMLVWHGMAVFATEGRFGQLLAKTCVALLLGWHVYALLLPYLLLGMVAAFRRRDGIGARRHLTLGVVALTFGTMVLATNFAREYLALGGEVAPTQLPSVESMLMRTGLAGPQAEDDARAGAAERGERVEREWPAVAARQLKRIAWSVPYAVGYFVGSGKPDSDLPKAPATVVLGLVLAALVVAVTVVLFLSPAVRHRIPLVALALSGPCWAFGMPNQSWHPFEGLFDVGIPLAFFALLLPQLDRLFGDRVGASMLAGVAAVPTFALSSFLMARATAPDPEHVAYERALAADVDSIRELAVGKTILVSEAMDACKDWNVNRRYYFTGYVTVMFSNTRFADFVVSERIEGAATLTPANRVMFLYDPASHAAAMSWYERQATRGVPVLDSPDYDLYLLERGTRNELLYFRDHCPEHQINDRFYAQNILMGAGSHVFVHVWPTDANDLSMDRRQFGFEDLVDFKPLLSGWRKDGKCYAVCHLPDYDIARIEAGSATKRRTSYGGILRRASYDVTWEGSFSPRRAAGEVPVSPPAAEESR